MELILIILGVILLVPSIILYSSFSWGYVATILINWFILPIYPEFPVFTWFQLAGFMFVVNCFVHGSSIANNLKKEYEDSTKSLILLLLAPWMTLLGAWVFHLFY